MNGIKNIFQFKKRLWFCVILFFAATTVFLFLFVEKKFFFREENVVGGVENAEKTVGACNDCKPRRIDGVLVENGMENLFPVSVIIENHPDARPQSGLSSASLVFEAEAEGGITRFLAVFDGGVDIGEIGPIRSARPYFVDWVKELSSLFVHVGGSPEALTKIKEENILDLNEFYRGEYFWRDDSRFAPHNVYISMEKMKLFLDEKEANEGTFFGWKFAEERQEREISDSEISIGFKSPDFAVKWRYNQDGGFYERYLAGEAHRDILNNEIIKAENVIVAYVSARVIDSELRLEMDHVGSGDAVVCFSGQCLEGRWSKRSVSERMRFFKSDGEEFVFNPGQSWVEIVRGEREVDY